MRFYLTTPGELAVRCLSNDEMAPVQVKRVDSDPVDQIFDFVVRDLSRFALQLYSKPSSTPDQMACCQRMIRKPAADAARYARIWETEVFALRDAYEMNA